MKTLYLGLNCPNPSYTHYPVIRTEKLNTPELMQAETLWPQFSHVIFTSQTTVQYWELSTEGKVVIAIGKATAKALRHPLIAPEATQEGVIDLLKTMKPRFVFLPQSRRARPNLVNYLTQKKIPYFHLELYDTYLQKPEPVPNLEAFDEIIFTSPSTVEGFLQIYGQLPKDKKLTSIGPITQRELYRE